MNKFLISVSSMAMALVMSSTALGAVTVFSNGQTISSSAMNTNFANLNGNLTDGTCIGAMTRVGPLCVDTVRQAASITWITAVNTCRTAGKRLLTPGEYMAAKNQAGGPTGMNTPGEMEWVDSVGSSASEDSNIAGGLAGRLTVGYIGPSDGIGTSTVPAGEIFFGTNAAYDAGFHLSTFAAPVKFSDKQKLFRAA